MSVNALSLSAAPRTPLVILSVYLVVTLVLAWVIVLPLVIADPVDRAAMPLEGYYNAVMVTPLFGALVAFLLERRQPMSVLYSPGQIRDLTGGAETNGATRVRLRPQSLTDALGITPLRPLSGLLAWCVLALLLFFAFSLAALGIGALLGVYPLDMELPVFVAELEHRLGHEPTEYIATGLLVELATVFVSAVALMVLHAGMEMGWRGYLFPRLQIRWGALRAVVATGVASGLWYAPLLYLGFFYNVGDVFQSLVLMIGYCLVIGGVLAWLRMRAGSIWPAAFAQSMITAAAVLHFWFAEQGVTVDLRAATLQGWSGWILPGALLLVLLLRRERAFRPRAAAPRS